MPVNFWMEVIDACHYAGLVVVAAMHNKGASSVKVLKRLSVYEKTLFFRFHDQELIAVFDPPYHLKYM
jgi:hypothetical protein